MLGLRKLIRNYKIFHPDRKLYKSNLHIVKISVDKCDYIISLIPTILFQPWFKRYPGDKVFEIYWLNISIAFGEWEKRKENKNEQNN